MRPRAQVRRVVSWIGFTFRCEFSTLHKQPEVGRAKQKEALQHGDLLAKTIDRIRWRLWHGRPQGALDLIAEILEELETPKRQIQMTAVYIKKLTGVLRDSGHMSPGNTNRLSIMPPCGVLGEPISTAQTESFCIVG